jgi:hypothetical protein
LSAAPRPINTATAAGILAGNDGTVYRGVAYDANLVNLRVLDANGNGSDSAAIQAIATAIQLSKTYNIRVINRSLGRRVYESASLDPLCQAVEAALKSGIFVAVAATGQCRACGARGDDGSRFTLSSPWAVKSRWPISKAKAQWSWHSFPPLSRWLNEGIHRVPSWYRKIRRQRHQGFLALVQTTLPPGKFLPNSSNSPSPS